MDKDIDKPAHYNQGDVECIDAIRACLTPEEFQGYLRGNVLKYTWRMMRKDTPEQNIGKAKWYLSRLREAIAKAI